MLKVVIALAAVALAAVSSRADVISANANSQTITTTYYPGFSVHGIMSGPGFNPQLGTLDSVTIDWNAKIFGYEHYETGSLDNSQVPLAYTQTASASVFGFSGSASGTSSTMVTAEICHSCGVGINFDISGTGTIYDPATLQDFVGPWAFGNTSAGVEGQSSGVNSYVTSEFLWPASNADWSATLSYCYTPVPEPRWSILIVLVFGAFLICRSKVCGLMRARK